MADIIKTSYMDKPVLGYSEYLCKDKKALSAKTPKPGDRALVVSEGKVYFCVKKGTWLEWGKGGSEDGFPYLFTIDDFENLDDQNGLLFNEVGKFGYKGGNNYKMTITYNGIDYAETVTAEQQDAEDGTSFVGLQFYFEEFPETARPHYTSMFVDGMKLNVEEMSPEYGDFGVILFLFANEGADERYQAFKTGVSKITIEEVSE